MRNPLKETTYAVAYRNINADDKPLLFAEEPKEFELIKTHWRYWYADPMVFSYQGEDWLFVEKMDRLKRIGCISAAKIEGNTIGEFKDVLNEQFHLSYPMIFEKDGRVYMIPESTSDHSVKLYLCKRFPDKWELQCTLFEDVLYADTNVVFFENQWYLITGEMDPKLGSKTKLLVFLADNIEKGELLSLNENKNSNFSFKQRGAGNFFECNGDLLRPIQCGNEAEYGKYLRFTKANPKNIDTEEEIASIQTDNISVHTKRTPVGTHTYAVTNNLEIIDLKFEQTANIPVIFSKLKRKVRKKK